MTGPSWRRDCLSRLAEQDHPAYSFVSLLSDADVPIERISRLVGHSNTVTTETIYRKQIRPVIEHGADVKDRIFPTGTDRDAQFTELLSTGTGQVRREPYAF